MTLTAAMIEALFPRGPDKLVGAIIAQHVALLGEFGIASNLIRTHFFLAQVGHESGGLTVGPENMNYRAERIVEVWSSALFPSLDFARQYEHAPEKLGNYAYANRMGNGPPASGDGYRFRGRGLIQITGRDGYAEVGVRAGLDLVSDPDLALSPDNALRCACAFWAWKGLNPICDTGDFVRVTRRINGGTVGLADRKAWLDKVRRIMANPPPLAAQPEASTVIAVQLALRAKGFTEIGAADGLIGQRTTAAITEFRRREGLPAGMINAALVASLGL